MLADAFHWTFVVVLFQLFHSLSPCFTLFYSFFHLWSFLYCRSSPYCFLFLFFRLISNSFTFALFLSSYYFPFTLLFNPPLYAVLPPSVWNLTHSFCADGFNSLLRLWIWREKTAMWFGFSLSTWCILLHTRTITQQSLPNRRIHFQALSISCNA